MQSHILEIFIRLLIACFLSFFLLLLFSEKKNGRKALLKTIRVYNCWASPFFLFGRGRIFFVFCTLCMCVVPPIWANNPFICKRVSSLWFFCFFFVFYFDLFRYLLYTGNIRRTRLLFACFSAFEKPEFLFHDKWLLFDARLFLQMKNRI